VAVLGCNSHLQFSSRHKRSKRLQAIVVVLLVICSAPNTKHLKESFMTLRFRIIAYVVWPLKHFLICSWRGHIYGDELTGQNFFCPRCGYVFDFSIGFSDPYLTADAGERIEC
jgi:hypothetical protein